MSDEHQHHHQNHLLRNIGIGTSLVLGGVLLAPYLLPVVGLGESELAIEALGYAHGPAGGMGFAGALNAHVAAIPLIGAALTKGGLWTSLAVGVTGIGGQLLGRFIEKKQDGTDGINWGKVIRYGALASSVLLALPTMLTGITAGLTYIAYELGGDAALTSALTFLQGTLGTIGAVPPIAALTGVLANMPHLLSCSLAIIPATIALLMNDKAEHAKGTITAQMEIVAPPKVGKPYKAHLILCHADTGLGVTPEDLAVTHTKKLHLLVVDESLQDYHHIHPEPTKNKGVYKVEFTPNTPNKYHVWADFTTQADGKNHVLHSNIPAEKARSVKPEIEYNDKTVVNGMVCSWKAQQPLQAGKDCMVNLTIVDKNGVVNDLEPVMGAYAHLVGFSADGKSVVHCHPMGVDPTSETERGAGLLQFHVTPKNAGDTQFYLQIKRGGKEIFVPFGQQVAVPEKHAETHSQRLAHQHQHAAAFAR